MSDPFLTAMGIVGARDLTEEVLAETLGVLAAIYKGMDLEPTKRRLEELIGISMRAGEGITSGENEPWLSDAKSSIRWNYWDSYLKQLQSDGFTASALRAVDEDTDNILTECGNPAVDSVWRIQGLVMGDVQSGKTANYCGLISKAADAGYKVIVLLTGMIEELRSQTQERMDEGFVGRDSKDVIGGIQGRNIGAGRFRTIFPNVLTSVDSDFLTANQIALQGIPLQNLNEPLLLVLKKNNTPLRRLLTFLRGQMQHGSTQLNVPLFLVDDEADNASVNARRDENPALINSLIRELMDQFRQASYVGYTATPFANVFINPDPDRKDLFPSNFIYSLRAPSNYIGAGSIFSEDGDHRHQLVNIVDAETVFPERHTKHLEIADLPQSLKDAVGTFLVSCAIRDLRDEPLHHRSMLINVTRFTDVQSRLMENVNAYLFTLVNEVKQYLADDDLWRGHKSLVSLQELFLDHYVDSDVEWDAVRAKLYDSVASVKVLTINQKTEAENKLNYRRYKNSEKGRRVIAIGGLTLSRGLTLEGLCVSYFFRNSKAYDTLLQMGRWFGYRTGYEDLCRIWMAPEAQSWFAHIAKVVSELRADIRHMHSNHLPPSEFGIRVRSHPDTLLVTAANKMRNSEEVELEATFSGRLVETAILPISQVANARNAEATDRFLRTLGNPTRSGERFVWSGVAASEVGSFLSSLDIPRSNQAFMADRDSKEQPLVTFIAEGKSPPLDKWDVCVPQGDGTPADGIRIVVPDGEEMVRRRQRQFERPRSTGAAFIRANKQRVGDISDERIGLRDDQVQRAEADWLSEYPAERKGKRVPGEAYRNVRTRPLLTIHLIEPTDAREGSKSKDRMMPIAEIESQQMVAISLSFPRYDDSSRQSVTYRINKVYLQSVGAFEGGEELDEDLD